MRLNYVKSPFLFSERGIFYARELEIQSDLLILYIDISQEVIGMEVQIKDLGNGQGICLTESFLKENGLKINDVVEVSLENNKMILTKKFIHKTLKERSEPYGGELRLTGEFDWGEPCLS